MLYHGDSLWTGSYNVPAMEVGLDYETARDATPQWWAVCRGNGNDGVSRSNPAFFVRATDPWQVARLAMLDGWSASAQPYVAQAMDVDGDGGEYGATAVLYEGPGGETQFGAAEDIVEVYPVDEADMQASNALEWDSLLACFGEELLTRYPG